MRSGIITFHNEMNYGATLQAYALYKKLKDLHGECSIINYVSQGRRTIKFSLLNPVGFFVKKITERKFERFLSQNVSLTCECFSNEELKLVCKDFDFVVSGSDQVWNPKLSVFDTAYLLDFLEDNHKKMSYAASFGDNNGIIDSYDFEEYLKKYNILSVREEESAEKLSSLLKKSVRTDVDPVLLLTAHEWKNISENKISENKISKTKYIVLYLVGKDLEAIEYARKLSRETGLRVVWLSDGMKYCRGIKRKRCASPKDFIRILDCADYVVTNSFHATAFSILFHKPYYSFANNKARIKNLMESIDITTNTIDNLVNWNKIDKKLEDIRNVSITHLMDYGNKKEEVNGK